MFSLSAPGQENLLHKLHPGHIAFNFLGLLLCRQSHTDSHHTSSFPGGSSEGRMDPFWSLSPPLPNKQEMGRGEGLKRSQYSKGAAAFGEPPGVSTPYFGEREGEPQSRGFRFGCPGCSAFLVPGRETER